MASNFAPSADDAAQLAFMRKEVHEYWRRLHDSMAKLPQEQWQQITLGYHVGVSGGAENCSITVADKELVEKFVAHKLGDRSAFFRGVDVLHRYMEHHGIEEDLDVFPQEMSTQLDAADFWAELWNEGTIPLRTIDPQNWLGIRIDLLSLRRMNIGVTTGLEELLRRLKKS